MFHKTPPAIKAPIRCRGDLDVSFPDTAVFAARLPLAAISASNSPRRPALSARVLAGASTAGAVVALRRGLGRGGRARLRRAS